MLDPFSPESPDDVSHLKSLQADIHQQFIDMVKRRRGSKLTGKMLTCSPVRSGRAQGDQSRSC